MYPGNSGAGKGRDGTTSSIPDLTSQRCFTFPALSPYDGRTRLSDLSSWLKSVSIYTYPLFISSLNPILLPSPPPTCSIFRHNSWNYSSPYVFPTNSIWSTNSLYLLKCLWSLLLTVTPLYHKGYNLSSRVTSIIVILEPPPIHFRLYDQQRSILLLPAIISGFNNKGWDPSNFQGIMIGL